MTWEQMMNTTSSPTKMAASKAFTSKINPIVIAAVLALLAEGVLNPDVAASVAPDAINTVEGVIIKYPRAAESQYVGHIHVISNFRVAEQSHFVSDVMASSSGEKSGLALGGQSCFLLLTTQEMEMDEKSVLNNLEKKILAVKKFGVFDDSEGRQLLKCYQHGIQDSFIVGSIERRVDAALRRRALSGSPFLPPRLNKGDFVFGVDQWNNRLFTYMQYFNAHTLIVANTGAGKTNLSLYHAMQIAVSANLRGLWLIDLRKKEYRSLRPILARAGIDLKIIRGRKFCINPLQVPDGVEPIEYAAVAADLLVRVLNLPPRASTLLRSTLIKLYRQHGILDGGQKYPTLFHLFEAVRADRSANPQARLAVLDNLEAMLQAMGPMLAYYRGWDVHELAQQHLAMEFTGLPEAGKDLILNYLLTAEIMSRIARGISNPNMDLWISFDEGQRLFSQRKETASYGGNALIDLTGLVRGTGIGLEISVLTTNDLSTSLPSLTSTKIIGRCGSLAEYTAAGRFVGLNSEQIMWCAHHLVPGMFVGQVGEGDWRHPFLFRVPLLKKKNSKDGHVSDREADSSLKDSWGEIPSAGEYRFEVRE
jgi:hypothetical protein